MASSVLQTDTWPPSLPYEDVRRHRLEENQKRMQELGLANLSKSLISDVSVSKPPLNPRHVKPRTLKDSTPNELRRSSRVANNPSPDYREVDAPIFSGRRSYSSRASSLLNRKYASDEARLDAILNAETILKQLPPSNPSFVKAMLQSHVTGGFWLGLPSGFCKAHLPKKDETIVLENEKGEEWDTVYLANKTGLSGGWRGFSLDHGLVDGDALVFELVQHCRFKVHIVRGSEPETTDACKINSKTVEIAAKKAMKGIKTEHVIERTVPQEGKGKKQELMEEEMQEPEEDGSEGERHQNGVSLRNGSKKRKRGDEEDVFELDTERNDLKAFLRTRKAHYSSSSASASSSSPPMRASKRAMTNCSGSIQVC